MADRPPDLDDGEATGEERVGFLEQDVAHPLRSRPFSVVVVHARHDLANPARLAQIIIGRAQRMIEYKYPRGASLGFN